MYVYIRVRVRVMWIVMVLTLYVEMESVFRCGHCAVKMGWCDICRMCECCIMWVDQEGREKVWCICIRLSLLIISE